MALYKMEIFEPRKGYTEPVLRERHDIHSPNDQAAIVQARQRYDEVAATLKNSQLTLNRFCLYDSAGRLVREERR
jgi:hypothetical protein